MRTSIVVASLLSATTAAAQPSQQPQDPYAPAPYAPPPAYAPPAPMPPPGPVDEPSGELEVVADFAGLGVLASATLLDRTDHDDPGTGTLIVVGGALGGGATGWILADRLHVTRSEAHATTMGLTLGLANGALLLVPLDRDDRITSEDVLGTLLVGGTIGAGGGLALGKSLRLTRGQSVFATNLSLLGLGTSAMVGALIDRDDGELDRAEMTSLVVGLDGGLAAGLLVAPKIEWSYGRARFVGAASLVGTFLGGMVGGLLATDRDETTGEATTDPDIAVVSMLVGMWGGFAGGIAITNDWAPDPRFHAASAPPITATPMVGEGRVGVVATGSF